MKQNYNKQYYEENKQYWRDYAERNKEKINEYIKEKFTCNVCQGTYTIKHKKQHESTAKHQKRLLLIND
jgi:hypothetical protein